MEVLAINRNRLIHALVGNGLSSQDIVDNELNEEGSFYQDPMRPRGWWGNGWHTAGNSSVVLFRGRSWLKRRNAGRFNGSYSPVR
eukprot:15445492-Alexandrium_andersonii.AAC.1